MKRLPLAIIIFIFFANSSLAQTYSADSLKKVLHTVKQDTEKVNTLLHYAGTFENTNVDTALTLALQALQLSRNSSWQKGIANSLYDVGIFYDIRGEFGRAEKYEDSSMELCKQYGFGNKLASVNNALGNLLSEESQYSKALDYYYKALGYDSIMNKGSLPDLYNNIGLVFSDQGSYVKAEEYYFKSLEIYDATGNKDGTATTLSNLGNIYEIQGEHDKALKCYTKALDFDVKIHKDGAIASDYSNIGNTYLAMNKYSEALDYIHKSIQLSTKIGQLGNISNDIGNIGLTFINFYEIDSTHQNFTYTVNGKEVIIQYSNILDSALYYELKAQAIAASTNNKQGLVYAFQGLGSIFSLQRNNNKAIDSYEAGVALADSLGLMHEEMEISQSLAHTLIRAGNYQLATKYFDKVLALKDSLFGREKEKETGKLEAQFEYDKKLMEQHSRHEKEQAIAEEQNKREKYVIASVSLGLVAVLALLLVIFRRFRITNEQKKVIEEQKKEVDTAYDKLNSTHALLQEKDKDITDSIAYARKIQSAILPSEEQLKDSLGNCFILYKPRDVVSGDFYWCHTAENKVVFAVVDCTGHGVPGAFMSMIGNSVLNQVVIENNNFNSAEILNKVRNNLLKQLQQKGQEAVSRDGMDMALCVWDKIKNTLQYSGANSSLYMVRKNINSNATPNPKMRVHGSDMLELLADKQPIGYQEGRMETTFTSQTLNLQKGDCIYITSDGYQDQFGGEKNKKFTSRALRNLLVSINNQPVIEQKNILDTTIEKWKNTYAQTDDICVMGIKII